MKSPSLLTTAETADALGKSVRTVQYYVQTGRLVPALQAPGINGAYFFDAATVEALRLDPVKAEAR